MAYRNYNDASIRFSPTAQGIRYGRYNHRVCCSQTHLKTANGVTFTGSGTVGFFGNNGFPRTHGFTTSILGVVRSGTTTRFVITCYSRFYRNLSNSVAIFFGETRSVPLRCSRIHSLVSLFRSALCGVHSFRIRVMSLIITGVRDVRSQSQLRDFVSTIYPFYVTQCTSRSFVATRQRDFCRSVTTGYGVPGAYLTLLGNVERGPKSPCGANSFTLQEEASCFLRRCIRPIKHVIGSVGTDRCGRGFLITCRRISRRCQDVTSRWDK